MKKLFTHIEKQVEHTYTNDAQEDIKNRVIDMLLEEWVDTLMSVKSPEEEKAISDFAKTVGCTLSSPFAMMYRGFRAGVTKGFEFCERIDEIEKRG